MKSIDPQTATLWDNDHFMHPWEGMAEIGHNARSQIDSAGGIYVTDTSGRTLIDGPGGMWCVQIGYGRDEMADAMADQARKLAYYSPFNNANPVAAQLAHELAQRAPGDLNHVFFTTGGSTAVDTALRFVQFRNNLLGRPEKKIILSREKAYHGSTFLSASVSARERDRLWLDKAEGVTHFLPQVAPRARSNSQDPAVFLDEKMAEMEAAITSLGADKVAAFIAEPLQASGGVLIPPAGYHRRCRELCDRYDIVYIADEVVTGFGRLGHWFASEPVFDMVPDIITCAKGLTSGYVPMGAVLVSDRLLSEIAGDPARPATFSNGFTYSGHPVAAAAALKNIEIIEHEDILGHVRAITPLFLERLHALAELPLVIDTRGQGLLGCIECSRSGELADDVAIGARIDEECQKRGLIVRPIVNMCVISPPLVISEDEINQLFDIFEQGIRAADQT